VHRPRIVRPFIPRLYSATGYACSLCAWSLVEVSPLDRSRHACAWVSAFCLALTAAATLAEEGAPIAAAATEAEVSAEAKDLILATLTKDPGQRLSALKILQVVHTPLSINLSIYLSICLSVCLSAIIGTRSRRQDRVADVVCVPSKLTYCGGFDSIRGSSS
jgi:hypothetical protein